MGKNFGFILNPKELLLYCKLKLHMKKRLYFLVPNSTILLIWLLFSKSNNLIRSLLILSFDMSCKSQKTPFVIRQYGCRSQKTNLVLGLKSNRSSIKLRNDNDKRKISESPTKNFLFSRTGIESKLLFFLFKT